MDRYLAAFFFNASWHPSGGEGDDIENEVDPYLPLLARFRLLETIQNGTPPVGACPALCKCATELIPPVVVVYLAVTSEIKEKTFK
jgi:hypothetical protein